MEKKNGKVFKETHKMKRKERKSMSLLYKVEINSVLVKNK